MAPLVLATVNARYAHASLGLRYLKANLGPLADQCALCEFTLSERPADIVEALLAHAPQVVGFGVYVWNVGLTLEVVRALKQVAPQVVVVLGAHEPKEVELADSEIDLRIDQDAGKTHPKTLADKLAALSGRGRRELYERIVARRKR